MGDADFSLLSLKGLSKPASKLVEAVRSAFGAVHEPIGIRRKADAEAEAAVTGALGEADAANIKAKSQVEVAKILAEGGGEIAEIEQRAAQRLLANDVREQKNIEAITLHAVAALPESVSDEPVDGDWVYQFFEHVKGVGNDQMQSLWGRLLAGEVAKPGSFSLRTLRVVKDLATDDAHLFTSLCGFLWTGEDGFLFPFIREFKPIESLPSRAFYPVNLLHLETLGLVQCNLETEFGWPFADKLRIAYHGKSYDIVMRRGKYFKTGHVTMTRTGAELMPIAGARPTEEHREYVIEQIKSQGFAVTEVALTRRGKPGE